MTCMWKVHRGSAGVARKGGRFFRSAPKTPPFRKPKSTLLKPVRGLDKWGRFTFPINITLELRHIIHAELAIPIPIINVQGAEILVSRGHEV